MKIYNSLTKRKEEFVPLEAGKVKMYACGITVSGEAHIGHGYQALIYDIMRKYLEKVGYKVTYARNYTDVDDKIIAKSKETGIPADVYAAEMIGKINEVMDELHVDDPDVWLKATENIGNIVDFIRRLIEKGHAYATKKGDVYFDVDSYPAYGHLSNRSLEDALDGVRVDNDDEKKNAYDFALWKSAKEGEICWDSPWGKGRPGWHIECSAMSSEYLGDQFDIHTGGIDNMFPHHEDEIAQSEAASGKKWVNYWLHCAHLMVNGEKMSKSLGNFFTLRDLQQKGWKGREIRWVLIGAHYRRKLNFTLEALGQARETLARFDEFFDRMRSIDREGDGSEAELAVSTAAAAFSSAIADDLNISEALAAMFELLRSGNKLADAGGLSKAGAERILGAFRRFDSVIGALEVDAVRCNEVPPEVVQLAEERKAARLAKNFAESDRLRDEIAKLGYVVEDQPKQEYRLKKA